ncbi:MAG: DUF3052 domain-containing protein [Bacteroidia bacterium]|nr:DUF3052 domain-containing protein [Bacteroidia bacterium]
MAGYSGTPLAKKLGLKPHTSIYLLNMPDTYLDWVSPLPEGLKLTTRLSNEVDFIHLFVKDQKTFKAEFVKSKEYLKKDGMMWISWPKKASKVPTDLDENFIRDFGLKQKLVDVKVCAVDDVWSGLKFVYRVADR